MKRSKEDRQPLTRVFDEFIESKGQSINPFLTLFTSRLKGELVIPDFKSFSDEIITIYNKLEKNLSGSVANYIPQLARVNPDQFAVSICTIDGQRFDYGDFNTDFCLQSTCKPINYCIAHESLGESVVHKHIGREPSGRSFNELALCGPFGGRNSAMR